MITCESRYPTKEQLDRLKDDPSANTDELIRWCENLLGSGNLANKENEWLRSRLDAIQALCSANPEADWAKLILIVLRGEIEVVVR